MIVSHEVHIGTTDLSFVYDVFRLSYLKKIGLHFKPCIRSFLSFYRKGFLLFTFIFHNENKGK